jgi:hypothetical protein
LAKEGRADEEADHDDGHESCSRDHPDDLGVNAAAGQRSLDHPAQPARGQPDDQDSDDRHDQLGEQGAAALEAQEVERDQPG